MSQMEDGKAYFVGCNEGYCTGYKITRNGETFSVIAYWENEDGTIRYHEDETNEKDLQTFVIESSFWDIIVKELGSDYDFLNDSDIDTITPDTFIQFAIVEGAHLMFGNEIELPEMYNDTYKVFNGDNVRIV